MGGPALVPVMFAPPPTHQSYPSPQSHRKGKHGQSNRHGNKKVHYRNTPVVLGRDSPSTSDSPNFRYISKRRNEYDVFDPGQNPVLARYQVG